MRSNNAGGGATILQAVEFAPAAGAGFDQQTQFGAVDRQFTGLGFEQFTFA